MVSPKVSGRSGRRVLVIGLDCATPQLVFDQWRDELPNLKRLMEHGLHGELESTIPPITVPAWMSMMTSKNPGRLGLYGFRNRTGYTYEELGIANSTLVKEDTVWDILSRAGKQVVLVGVPQTYPPKPINGHMVTCFLTPNAQSRYTYPDSLKEEIRELVGEYIFDVENFRTEDKGAILRQIYEMTEKRFRVVRHLLKTKPWDFFMVVEMGTDRIHHGFWKYSDPEHRKYPPESPFRFAIRDYYRYVDGQVGELLSALDDDTVVLVVSDHGAKRMDGGICLNEWLIREGYLTLVRAPDEVMSLGKVEVDWGRTIAWGSGGYYGRVFLNVKGREPNGVIDPSEYERVRSELAQRLQAIPDDQGRPLDTRVYRPEDVYPECRGIPPDLIVYFGDLYWRAVGSVGVNAVHVFDNDTGPDDANHAQHGIFILFDPRRLEARRLKGLHLRDVAPTILEYLGVPVPEDMEGTSVKAR